MYFLAINTNGKLLTRALFQPATGCSLQKKHTQCISNPLGIIRKDNKTISNHLC